MAAHVRHVTTVIHNRHIVTNTGVSGRCQPMTILFPTQQQQSDELDKKLRLALGAADRSAEVTSRRATSPGCPPVATPAFRLVPVVFHAERARL